MEINFFGIGGAFNYKYGNNCSYIKQDDNLLLIDIGLDTFERILNHKILDNVNDIYVIVTHLHGDHVGGLPTFIQYVALALKKKVKIIINSDTFKQDLKQLLNITGVAKTFYFFVEKNELPFTFKVELKRTTHSPLLECYSIIFSENNKKILYTSDTNDIEYVKEKINDPEFVTIYSEVGENSSVHLDINQLLELDTSKLIFMHLQSEAIYKRLIEKKCRIAEYLK